MIATTPSVSLCPVLCVCEIRPWFTPRSTHRQARTVDCNGQQLPVVPPGILPDTEVLLLQGNAMMRANPFVERTPNLTDLDLSQNRLTSLPDSGLAGLSHLVTLHLEENGLVLLPGGTLRELSSLQELYLNHNLIKAVAPLAFSGLHSLLRLHLNANRLRSINAYWFAETPKLEVLTLGDNPVASVEARTFRTLPALRSLVLAGTHLTELPDEMFFGLDSLESLSLHRNRFKRVPRVALHQVSTLKFLDLNQNPVTRLAPGDFRGMPHLRDIALSGMPHLALVDAFAFDSLPELRRLEATGNSRLCYVDRHAFRAVPHLEIMLFSDAALPALAPASPKSLPGLRELALRGNPLRCDCANSWLANSSTFPHLLEPQETLCASPPALEGLRIREATIPALGSPCPPMIAPLALPRRLEVLSGTRISLHCRAVGDPEPTLHWVTPGGQRLVVGSMSSRARVDSDGTLRLNAAAVGDAGLYTCVARNVAGVDTRSVALQVNASAGSIPSLQLSVTHAADHFILISWALGGRDTGQGTVRRWSMATVHVQSGHGSYTAHVPVAVREYNLTHLNPGTLYEVCLTVAAPRRQMERSCVNTTTKALQLVTKHGFGRRAGMILATLLAGLLIAAGLALLTACAARYLHRSLYNQSFKAYGLTSIASSSSSIPLNDLYPPLIAIWESDGEREKEALYLDYRPESLCVDTSKSYMG
uniref:leucine-rich repeat neuronal protein 1-like n=1 Tax=Myxine glutinosa TaxID=7769 RepID=UPI00358EE9B3